MPVLSMQSLGEIELSAPVVRAKIGVFLYVTLGLPVRTWGTQFKQILCDGLWVDFDAVFNTFFQIVLLFQMRYILLIFVAS